MYFFDALQKLLEEVSVFLVRIIKNNYLLCQPMGFFAITITILQWAFRRHISLRMQTNTDFLHT